jgi:hypothetical protein
MGEELPKLEESTSALTLKWPDEESTLRFQAGIDHRTSVSLNPTATASR